MSAALEVLQRLVAARVLEAPAGQAMGPTADAPAWERLAAAAERHGLLALLDDAVSSGAVAVPAAAREGWSDAVRGAKGRALAAAADLRQVLDALTAAAVPVLPYKGPWLSHEAYGDLGARDVADLDLLVPPAALARAEAVLAAQGWSPPPGRDARLRAALYHSLGAVPWRRAGHVMIELHWRACEPRLPWQLPVERLLAGSARGRLLGSVRPVLALRDAVLLLAWHGTRHVWSRLEWVASWGALASRCTPPDWAVMEAEARRVGGHRALRLAIAAARASGIPLRDAPPADDQTVGLATVVAGWRAGASDADAQGAAYRRFLLALLERAVDRARFRWHTAFAPTEREWEWMPLPASLRWLYPAVRVLRLSRRAVGG